MSRSDLWYRRPSLTISVIRAIPALILFGENAPPEARPALAYLLALKTWYLRRDKTRPPIAEVIEGTWIGCDQCGRKA